MPVVRENHPAADVITPDCAHIEALHLVEAQIIGPAPELRRARRQF